MSSLINTSLTNHTFDVDPNDHYVEINNLITAIQNMKPVYLTCDEATQDCNQMEFHVPHQTYFLFDNVYHASTDEYTKFYVFASPSCAEVTLPTPYLQNTIIKACLSASSSAKKFATKVIKQSVVGVFGNQYTDAEKYKCQHMIVDNTGASTIQEKPCIDLSDGSNLVRCFFELRTEFAYNLNYECFFPQLWTTWFASFTKVFNAMRTKGYAVTTDNLQARYCYWTRKENCDAQPGNTELSSICTAPVQDDARCLITYDHYCQANPSSFNWPDLTDSDGNVESANPEIISARTWIEGNAPAGYVDNLAEHTEICSNRNPEDENAGDQWYGRTCKTHHDAGNMQQYYDCLLNYPLTKVEKLLEGGAIEFPHVEFEKKSPITMVMIGFKQECNRYVGSTVEAPQTSNDLWIDCMDHYYTVDRTDDTDADLACTDYVQQMMFQCLNTHAGCTEYDNGFDYSALTDDQKKPWSVTCGTVTEDMRARRTGNQCDPTQFKTLCLEEKWNGWNFNGADGDTTSYSQMMTDGAITKSESDSFLADGINSNILDSIHEVLGIETHKADAFSPELGSDLNANEQVAIDSLDTNL